MTSPSRNLAELSARVHEANRKWWTDLETGERISRNDGEMLMLMVSELAEAMEGARKDLMDDHLPHRKMEEVEMADFIIRLLDYSAGRGIPLPEDWKSTELVGNLVRNVGEFLLVIVFHTTQLLNHSSQLRVLRLFSLVELYCDDRGLDLWGAFEEKMAYNAVRKDHTIEARKAAGGKKW